MALESPRFYVTSLTGYGLDTNSRSATFYQVIDTGLNYALVWEFFGDKAEARAERCCAELNAGRGVIGGLPHGSENTYKVRGCRCEFCCAAQTLYMARWKPRITRPGRAKETRRALMDTAREVLRRGGYVAA